MLNRLLRKSSGFTLIEVVIVLAIAGLIFVIVFLAVSQAQAGRRDTHRKADLNRIGASLDQYASNSQGNYPSGTEFTSTSSNYYTQFWNTMNLVDPGEGTGYTRSSGAITCGSGNVGSVAYQLTNRVYTVTMCLEKGQASVTNQ